MPPPPWRPPSTSWSKKKDEDDATTLGILATAKKTFEYETEYEYETIPKQEEEDEDDDDASLGILATATKTPEYETIPKQEDDAVVVAPLLPTLLRGAKKAVYQFLSDGDSEELSCVNVGDYCNEQADCCEGVCRPQWWGKAKCQC